MDNINIITNNVFVDIEEPNYLAEDIAAIMKKFPKAFKDEISSSVNADGDDKILICSLYFIFAIPLTIAFCLTFFFLITLKMKKR